MINDEYDVVVLGAGPAGTVAALQLARSDYRTLVVERTEQASFRIGEGLPPAATPMLGRLGLWDRFLTQGHRPSLGNASLWGSDRIHTTDFIRDPHGHGWHLDRVAFDRMLRKAASSAGAELALGTEFTGADASEFAEWMLRLRRSQETQTIRCRWVIDATGRAARFARLQGVARELHDHLTCFYALYQQSPEAPRDPDALTRIESARDGWWYSAVLPDHQRVVAYFAEAGSESCSQATQEHFFDNALQQTAMIGPLLNERQFVRRAVPHGTAANSGRLVRAAGPGWLAAGDAATSFDPLSSQGIYTAMYHGILAAETITKSESAENAVLWYQQQLSSVYRRYLENRARHYQSETRWSEAPFWNRDLVLEREPGKILR